MAPLQKLWHSRACVQDYRDRAGCCSQTGGKVLFCQLVHVSYYWSCLYSSPLHPPLHLHSPLHPSASPPCFSCTPSSSLHPYNPAFPPLTSAPLHHSPLQPLHFFLSLCPWGPLFLHPCVPFASPHRPFPLPHLSAAAQNTPNGTVGGVCFESESATSKKWGARGDIGPVVF